MCNKKGCYFISIIDISDDEAVYIHYDKSLKKVIFVQHLFRDTDYLADFHLKK